MHPSRKRHPATLNIDPLLRGGTIRRFTCVAMMLLLLGLTACASLGPQEKRLKVTLSSIMPVESTLMEQRYLVKLRVQNRSSKPLTIDGVSFDLRLNGKDFASGVGNQQTTIPGYGDSLLEMKVSSSLFGVIRQIQSIPEMEGKPLAYEISGNLSTPAHFFNLPFRQTGEIDLGRGLQ